MLYIVPTPIGNLNDMTFRAIEVLKEADVILAEDTRKSRNLLSHFDIRFDTLQAYHKFNEHNQLQRFVEMAQAQTVALVTDAGTPGISDPGFLLVRACVKADVEVNTLPGATAFVPALVNSGLPCDRFYFEGFLPHKKGRQKRLQFLANVDQTIVFYESPYRIVKTLTQMGEFFGEERQASVSREISKIYEETLRGTLAELAEHFTKKQPKGEFVIIVDGHKA
ncbi:MAG: 16S rRNA (cytidine(1402)-2'-O)-methyltransferase [Salinivirgaceae bacterium]|jgi:16S rRNA (cytidine1402-2'-O)-methyltransferase|nr:16S rRNA (cytidine(1402)-2'-O)-methyltransferase [Salinivirgaceae bacterium]